MQRGYFEIWDMRIYARWVKIVFSLRIPIAFLCITTARRWTAIGVGAFRAHPAIGPLSTASDPTLTTFLYNAQCRVSFCTRALLVHVFVVCVLFDDNVDHLIYPDEYYR